MPKRKKSKFRFDEVNIMYFLASLVGLVAFGLLIWFGYNYFINSNLPTALVEIPEKEEPCDFQRVLDGVCVESAEEVNPKLVVVMFDNHMWARPQIGLAEASIVYEAPVEGNFSRFMGLYPVSEVVAKVGPVRSARPYFLDWLLEYGDAMYFHVGGSPDALDLIKEFDINDFNEFYRGWYFWRDENRDAPHNTYTSSENWNEALERYEENYKLDNYDGWKFGKVEECEVDCANKIEVVFLPDSFDMTWEYNTSTAKYERYQVGRKHKDQDGDWIVADTVIVQKVETEILDGVGRLGMETIGSGEAIIFARGNVIEGEWRKEARKKRTRFFDNAGNEVTFQAGKIWVEVVNGRTTVEWMERNDELGMMN